MYRAPLRELRFVLEELLDSGTPRRFRRRSPTTPTNSRVRCSRRPARFAETVLEPLNRPGDLAGARWTPEGVVSGAGLPRSLSSSSSPAAGRRSAAPPEYGGQRVPRVLATAVGEFWGSANLAFKLCPMLTHGAVHALELCGSPAAEASCICRGW